MLLGREPLDGIQDHRFHSAGLHPEKIHGAYTSCSRGIITGIAPFYITGIAPFFHVLFGRCSKGTIIHI